MKLVRFSTNGQTPRLGVLQGDRFADLQASVAASLTRRGVSRAAEIASALVPNSTRAFLEGGPLVEETVAGIKEWVTIPANSARLHAPITDPGKFICIGLNYRDHAEEANQPIPKEPPIFAKWSNAILDPNEPILRPRGSNQLDWEVELGVVIGKTARFVSKEKALDYVWGYTIINDVSSRDFQFIGSQMQSGNTKTFIFDVRYIVSYLSGLMTLSPGDLIATGTPPGVGFARKPPVFLQPGDTCRLEITGLGQIENPVKEA